MTTHPIQNAILKNDPRILVSNSRQIFEHAATASEHDAIRLCVYERPENEKETLKSIYKKIGQLYRQEASLDLTSRATMQSQGLKVDIPPALIQLGAEADLMETAQIYAKFSGEARFDLKPSTVVNADPHPHATPVLSISWGGAGLAIDNNINGREQETFQLEEGDLGYLKPNMLHRSPYRSAPGRFVMFVAPPKGMS